MRDNATTLLYKWFNEVWNNDDESAIDLMMTHDSHAHNIITDGQPKGAEGFKIFFKGFRSQFHNIKVDIDDVISQDDMEAARTTVNAIHTPTGKNVVFTGMCMVRITEGKIGEAWNNYDFLTMYQQIGQTLAPAN
jgi:predicted ester cyclase